MNICLMHPADQLAEIMDRIYTQGLTTTSGGNISLMDENGDIWITPSGVDKGALTRKDMMQVKPSGEVIGLHTPSMELPFHRNIYRMRPDIRAVVHGHSPNLVAFSLARVCPDVRLTPFSYKLCRNMAMASYAIPGSELLGQYNSEQFARGHNVVMMENHGCVVGAEDLLSAFQLYETVDNAAYTWLCAERVGTPRPLTQDQLESANRFSPPPEHYSAENYPSDERAIRRDMISYIRRCYRQRLFISTLGTVSHRVNGNHFVITPERKDRLYIEPEELVGVKGSRAEAGKTPSRYAGLHASVYAAHPEVNSIFTAAPSAIMGFACSEAEFDSRTIPESYINLRYVTKLPFFSAVQNPQAAANTISARVPALILANEAVLTVGKTLHAAFDRLEVLEYSAKSLIWMNDIGPVVAISDAEVAEMDQAFGLN